MDKPLQSVAETPAVVDGHLKVALDHMPGGLVYTDEDLNIVFCNDRFREMYPVPAELLQPGQPYPQFLRHLATHGYYGKGDVDMMVARRVESLRHPTGKEGIHDRASRTSSPLTTGVMQRVTQSAGTTADATFFTRESHVRLRQLAHLFPQLAH